MPSWRRPLKRTSVPLMAGENLVGRDPAAGIRVDAVGVSRRHAMIVVADDEVTLHDLSSKNGTFVDDVRVTSPTLLQDRAQIRLGPLSIQFRRVSDVSATQTVGLPQSDGFSG
jgi:pSer/pThr/pTyr-binding forkhead associated (FHA) protein